MADEPVYWGYADEDGEFVATHEARYFDPRKPTWRFLFYGLIGFGAFALIFQRPRTLHGFEWYLGRNLFYFGGLYVVGYVLARAAIYVGLSVPFFGNLMGIARDQAGRPISRGDRVHWF